MTINFSKGYFFSFALAVIGIILLCNGFVSQYGIHHTVKLENLDINLCKTGEYVEGVITNYAGEYIPTLGNDIFSGESITFINGLLGGTYKFYTVQVKDNKYITVMLKNEELLDQLKLYSKGNGNDVYITGKIVKLPVELNYTWLEIAFETTDRTEINNRVNNMYAVKETDFTKEAKKIYEGITLILISVLLLFNSSGIKGLITKHSYQETSNQNLQFQKNYNIDYEIDSAKRQLEYLKLRQHKDCRAAICRLPILMLEAYICYRAFYIEFVLLFAIIMWVTISIIWKGFINSDMKLARGFSRFLNMKSLSFEIENCEQKIIKMEIQKQNEALE